MKFKFLLEIFIYSSRSLYGERGLKSLCHEVIHYHYGRSLHREKKRYIDVLSKASESYKAIEINGKDVVVIEEDIFAGKAGEKRKKVVAEYLKEHIGEVFTIIENGKNVYLGKDLSNEYIYSRTTKNLDRERHFVKHKAVSGIGKMIENATNER